MKKENLFEKGVIRTFSGIYFDILNPRPEMVFIEDIAHSLSMQPRFAGHTKRFLSVAEHCINCCNRSISAMKLEALLHDAAEAYILDIPSPIKRAIPDIYEIENRIYLAISQRFGIPNTISGYVKALDSEMLQYEWDNIVIRNTESIQLMSQAKAKTQFLKHFKRNIKY